MTKEEREKHVNRHRERLLNNIAAYDEEMLKLVEEKVFDKKYIWNTKRGGEKSSLSMYENARNVRGRSMRMISVESYEASERALDGCATPKKASD